MKQAEIYLEAYYSNTNSPDSRKWEDLKIINTSVWIISYMPQENWESKILKHELNS